MEIVLVLLILFFEGAALYLFVTNLKKYRLIKNTETSKLATVIRKGFYEVNGKIKAGEEKLLSPLSKVPCVYYKFIVEQEKGSGDSTRWVKVIEDEKFTEFRLQDHSGEAIINLKGSNPN